MFYLKQGDCLDVIPVLVNDGINVNGIITSPTHNFNNFIELFNLYDEILKENGTILFHLNQNDFPYFLINEVNTKTNFSVVNTIIWKTKPQEYVLVFVRKSEIQTYKSNKKSPYYIKSNDEFGLINELIQIYYQKDDTIMDNFSGNGTTMISCKKNKLNGIGIDISIEQIEMIKTRLQDLREDW